MASRATWGLIVVGVVGVALASGFVGALFGRQYQANWLCCEVPRYANALLSAKEVLGFASFPSQIGQDKWVSEVVFPGVTDGVFLDVGSANGYTDSNTFALERKGWSGICVDPFPTGMEGRTCQMFKEVAFSHPGKTVTFRSAGDLGGVGETLGRWKTLAEQSPTVDLITVTLGDILARANAPPYIHFLSLDIEGAELEALQGLPFDRYAFGAMAIEHNEEEPKRSAIQTLLERHGYTRVHTWMQDDFYLPAVPK